MYQRHIYIYILVNYINIYIYIHIYIDLIICSLEPQLRFLPPCPCDLDLSLLSPRCGWCESVRPRAVWESLVTVSRSHGQAECWDEGWDRRGSKEIGTSFWEVGWIPFFPWFLAWNCGLASSEFGNFRGHISCDIRMLVGHRFIFLILNVYMICVVFA